nr:phosphatase PAP2 family protein [Nocardioides perillae]
MVSGVYRRAYALLVGIAVAMGSLALLVGWQVGRPVVDPDGFLGPAVVRVPLLILGALALDFLPRTLWGGRGNPRRMREIAAHRWRTHWNRDRILLVVLGLVCFYTTYVAYRNLKSALPFVMGPNKYDRELHLIDQWLFLGNEPAVVLHEVFGWAPIAHALSSIYLWFLPLVPLAMAAWVVWSRNISFGYWFATSQSIIWTLGTASYYLLPTLGPGFEYPWLYEDLAETGTSTLMDSLFYGREAVLHRDLQDAVQSVAGFASLHTGVTLLFALMAQYTIRSRIVHWVFWVNFAVTVVATLYFGWHYVMDDVGGVVIALIAFYVGGLASGQKFDRKGLASHPTTTTSAVPVDD